MINFKNRINLYANISILLAEDNSLNRDMMIKVLDKMGYNNVTTVNDGDEAIQKYNENKYDILLLDNQMPNVSGIEVCKYIRMKNPTQTLIILTADPISFFSEDIQIMDDFCRKPIKMVDIDNLLQKWGEIIFKRT
jgi:CheY-like chemotaxis protein